MQDTTVVDLAKMTDPQIVDLLATFAATTPFDPKGESEAARKLDKMVKHRFVRTTYLAHYTRP